MSWIQTYTGRRVDPLAPDPDALDIADIAHALSQLCRFNGHCRTFYSVAEHSVRVARAVPPEDALWGLMHDASEPYLADVPRPLKERLPEYHVAEDRFMQAVAARFGLPWPMPESVHHADTVLLATEARDLMGTDATTWGIDVAPLPEVIAPWSPTEAEAAFLALWRELGG
ncbi:MAG: hypothetical protein EP329_06525 [Deltaproteobacteria bacterium]|nr:MAG: hypothetical protein EP329_06525 [Deltaproteobacteria bacterium]